MTFSIDTGKDATLFYAMAEETGGNVYIVDKPASTEEMLEFLGKKLTMGNGVEFLQRFNLINNDELSYERKNSPVMQIGVHT